MGLQALIFDIDGTVAETADLHRAAFNRAFDEHGLGWHWDREIYSQLTPVEFTLPKLRLFALAAQKTGHAHVPAFELLAKIATRKAHIFSNSVREGAARLRPGVARLMNEAMHDGLSLAAVSTSTRAETEALLSATLGFHALGWFSSLQCSENAGVPAAERSLYRAVLDDMGLSGRRAIAIDDSEVGANAAHRCGLAVIATPGIYTSSHQFKTAHLTISDLGQPAEPFTVLKGDAGGHPFVSPALLRETIAPKSAAA